MRKYSFDLECLCFFVFASNRWQALRRAARWYANVGSELCGDVYSDDPNVSDVRWYAPRRDRITMDSIVEVEDC